MSDDRRGDHERRRETILRGSFLLVCDGMSHLSHLLPRAALCRAHRFLEHRRYLLSEVFQGRLSYQVLRAQRTPDRDPRRRQRSDHRWDVLFASFASDHEGALAR